MKYEMKCGEMNHKSNRFRGSRTTTLGVVVPRVVDLGVVVPWVVVLSPGWFNVPEIIL